MSRRTRWRFPWPLWVLTLGVLGAATAYTMWGLPRWESAGDAARSLPGHAHHHTLHDESELIWVRRFYRGAEAFTLLWCLAVGASLGSFMNVVVYRTPRGMHANQGGSKCPYCRTPILAADNIPILGWLKLRGRCRTCRLPISRRYPIIESLVGMWFFVLALAELSTGGGNLPHFPLLHSPYILELIFRGEPVVFIALSHVLLGCSLLVIALIDWDGFRPPRSVVLWGLLIALVTAFLPLLLADYSHLSSSFLGVHWRTLKLDTFAQASMLIKVRAFSTLCGAVVGCLSGTLLDKPTRSQGAARILMIFGAALGWQASLLVGLLHGLVLLGTRTFLANAMASPADGLSNPAPGKEQAPDNKQAPLGKPDEVANRESCHEGLQAISGGSEIISSQGETIPSEGETISPASETQTGVEKIATEDEETRSGISRPGPRWPWTPMLVLECWAYILLWRWFVQVTPWLPGHSLG